MAPDRPACAARAGRQAAAIMVPSGWAVCRAPMASPRSEASNQPRTSRPLAALTDAPPAPAQASSTPKPTGPRARDDVTGVAGVTAWPDSCAAAIRPPAAMASPAVITTRSPYRSAAAPHATRATITPASGAAASALAPVSDSPNCWRRSGTRYGSP